jgi:alkyldihydroxyacetonephosphate synthase
VTSRKKKLGAWGFEGNDYPVPAALHALLARRLGPSKGVPRFEPSRVRVPRARTVPRLASDCSFDDLDRLAHARGQGLTDLIRLRTGTVGALPDAVVRPSREDEVEAVLQGCATSGVRVIPWGGGTSVTGGVNVIPSDEPVVTLDLERLSGLSGLDEVSGLATIGAGTSGPDIEASLATRGFTLGHFPQSFELSTLGGWIVTRASGQESLGYGSIQGMVAGLDVVAPAGRLSLPSFPASAAGPDLRQVVLGSEGRLGVVTRATVRVRRRPPEIVVTGTILPSWEAALDGAREILKRSVPLDLLRLSDAAETEVSLAMGLRKDRPLHRILQRLLSLRGVTEKSCLMLCGAAGGELDDAASILKTRGGIRLGTSPGARWIRDRYRLPYLRDSLLDAGYATDTLETAAPWSRLVELSSRVRAALEATAPVIVLCHVSHPYGDGASLYFTFFFACPSDPDEAAALWAKLKRAATEAVVSGGGTLSHHHGVGSWHAPWYEREASPDGARLVRGMAAALDPTGILNPHVLLDPADRLEV